MSLFKRMLMAAGGGAAGGPDLSISPSFSSKSEWTFDTDGDLNIGTHHSSGYTIQPLNGDVTVDIKMWGAGASSGWSYSSQTGVTMNVGPGGGGGAAVGRLVLKNGVNYILRIGEGGIQRTTGASSPALADYRAGGVFTTHGPEGAGYSGIFKTSATHGNAKLIAGGGGGGGDSSYDGSGAGAGGGTNGQASGGGAQGGGGGTQSAGGSASPYNSASAGSALTGGGGQSAVWYALASPGGGGYYGGGGGNVGGGGGGSGYYDSSDSDLTSVTLYTGNRALAGNNSDSDRGGAGSGANTQGNGTDGRIILVKV